LPIHGKVGIYICYMRKKSYNIRYFHGLDSFLSEEKRAILTTFGKVTAPVFNYKEAGVLQSINDSFNVIPRDTILIGSSFGGYIASVTFAAYNIPCLLFNPALKYREVEKMLHEPVDLNIKSLSYIVLGRQDEVIKCDDNLKFIDRYFKGKKEVVIEEGMSHRIPVDIFKQHVELFFQQLHS
jgi:hypothetical protein